MIKNCVFIVKYNAGIQYLNINSFEHAFIYKIFHKKKNQIRNKDNLK